MFFRSIWRLVSKRRKNIICLRRLSISLLLLLNHDNSFNLTQGSGRQVFYGHTAACWLADEMLRIDFIECLEISNLGQEASGLYHLAHIRAGFRQHSFDIFAALLCLFLNGFRHDFSLGRIDGNLPGKIQGVASLDGLAIWANCSGSIIRMNDLKSEIKI